MNRKNASSVQIKDADKGEVSAIIATFNVVDKDGDVVVPGAFEEGAPVRMSAYNHASWDGALPIGKGVIRTTDERAEFHGEVFMSNQAARETFEVIKQMGELQEYSWGFDIVEADQGEFEGKAVQYIRKVKTHEVSPVLLGASIGTGTLAVKGRKDQKLVDHLKSVLADVEELTTRVEEVVTLRAEEGKSLGSESADLLAELQSATKRLTEVMTAEPDKSIVAQELARYERRRAAL